MSMLAAQRAGLDPVRAGEFALLATEAARNVLHHGRGGEEVIWTYEGEHGSVGCILALDRGPGIHDVPRAFEEGYSTAGSLGMGLSSMKRMATSFEMFTAKTGTIVFMEVATTRRPDKLQIAGIALPFPGERLCGDAWTCQGDGKRTMLAIVDGLGHGGGAADAAAEAIKTFRKHVDRAPGAILSYMHDALKKTRGAAAAVMEIQRADRKFTYAGVGNTVAVLLGRRASRSLVSHNGTLGMLSPKIQEFCVEWPDEAVLILHSDGLQTRWDLGAYPGLLSRHAAVIGGALLRDYRRKRDDASVVVVKDVPQHL